MTRLAFAPLLMLMLAPALVAQMPSPDGDDAGAGQPPIAPLMGQVQGNTYYSPTGAFKMTIPVLADLGGTVSDTANVVTFQDPFSVHISIAAIRQDPGEKFKFDAIGPRDYLKGFFMQNVYPEFVTGNPKTHLDQSGLFNSTVMGGSFFTFLTLPGGSMFASPAMAVAPDAPPPVAKRGNMLFVHDGFVYVISTELAERVTEGSLYKKTPAQENAILEERLKDIANRITFLKPPPPSEP